MRVSVDDFQDDLMFRRIECVVAELLTKGNVVAPVDVLVGMGLLRPSISTIGGAVACPTLSAWSTAT